MNALSQEARALIDSVATRDDPSGADKARVRARLSAELGAAAFATLVVASAGGSAAAIASESASNAAKGGSLFGKLSAAGALAAAVACVLWLSRDEAGVRERPHTPAVVASSVAPSALTPTHSAQPSPTQQAAPVAERAAAPAKPEPKRTRASEARPQASGSASSQPDESAPAAASTLGLELKLLSAAQAALRAGTPERALVLAAEHRASFPDGVMKEERLGIEAIAGCALGRDYRTQAEAFLRSAKSSPLRARVQKACGIEP